MTWITTRRSLRKSGIALKFTIGRRQCNCLCFDSCRIQQLNFLQEVVILTWLYRRTWRHERGKSAWRVQCDRRQIESARWDRELSLSTPFHTNSTSSRDIHTPASDHLQQRHWDAQQAQPPQLFYRASLLQNDVYSIYSFSTCSSPVWHRKHVVNLVSLHDSAFVLVFAHTKILAKFQGGHP